MTKQKTYTDTVGRTFRQQGDQWQVLANGVGWGNFEGKTHIIDVGFIDQRSDSDKEEQDENWTDTTAAENDLFKHYVAVALPALMPMLGGGMANDAMEEKGYSHGQTDMFLASVCCDYAQAIIDELKERGRL